MAHGYPDFEGDKSGLYLKPEWAAKEGTDKSFYANRIAATFGQAPPAAFYLVPVGKTLYLNGLSFGVRANLVADADNNQMGSAYIIDTTTGDIYGYVGGNGGGCVVFPKPIVIPGGDVVAYPVVCQANHACDIDVTCWGYEI